MGQPDLYSNEITQVVCGIECPIRTVSESEWRGEVQPGVTPFEAADVIGSALERHGDTVHLAGLMAVKGIDYQRLCMLGLLKDLQVNVLLPQEGRSALVGALGECIARKTDGRCVAQQPVSPEFSLVDAIRPDRNFGAEVLRQIADYGSIEEVRDLLARAMDIIERSNEALHYVDEAELRESLRGLATVLETSPNA